MELTDETKEAAMRIQGRHGARARRAVVLAAAAALGAGATVGLTPLARDRATTTVVQTTTAATTVVASRTTLTAAQIYAQDAQSVVDISVTVLTSDPFGRTHEEEGEGSGFVIDKQGDIVTAAHVVEDATSIVVTFKDGTKANATVVGTALSSDLAVIRVKRPRPG